VTIRTPRAENDPGLAYMAGQQQPADTRLLLPVPF
jgi:hypothetical protein